MNTTSLTITIVLLVLIIAVLFTIIALAHLIIAQKKRGPRPKAPTSIITYFETGIAKGYKKEQLFKELINKGWNEEVIHDAWDEAREGGVKT